MSQVIYLVLGRPKELIGKEQPHLSCPVPLWPSITHSKENAKDRCCTSNLGGQVISSSFGCLWWKAIVSWVLIRFLCRYSIIGNLMIFSKPLLHPLKMGILTVLALWRVWGLNEIMTGECSAHHGAPLRPNMIRRQGSGTDIQKERHK